jgi:Ca2+-transporting ATPase
MERRKEAIWYAMDPSACLDSFEVNVETGLSVQQIQESERIHGLNRWAEAHHEAGWKQFLRQFQDFMVLVLLAAALLSGMLGEWLDTAAIIAIVILNAVFGYIQEAKAERSLEALKALSAPQATVCRAGEKQVLPAGQLVPGDIVHIHAGDRIPADVRWLHATSLLVEESALTGESEPVMKQTDPLQHIEIPLGERTTMGYLGTLALNGSGIGLVVHTGLQTEMGKIANLLQDVTLRKTPLQQRLAQLGKVLIGVAFALTLLVVGLGIWRGQPVLHMVLSGVSLAVAAIPEGLPAVVTIALALGVQRMIKQNAIVRKLPSVETLGCVEVICTDKTGTLTQNKMRVVAMHVLPGLQEQAYRIMRGCNEAEWRDGVGRGDPTELALLQAVEEHQPTIWAEERALRKGTFPFDSVRKRMSVVVEHRGKRYVYVKGAPNELLERCKLDPKAREQVEQQITEMAEQALRVIGFAMRPLPVAMQAWPADAAVLESDLQFVGLVGMIDPPRPEVKAAIQRCKQAGIRTIMITGDHVLTASAIANQLGLLRADKPTDTQVISGAMLERWTEREWLKRESDIAVYARVTPEHKLRIVNMLKKKGRIVAMTGDGVNDAPAIKAADIGIAMGITGTDVSKEAASLVLRDDHFATIVAAVAEGRNIYENVRKVIRYLLASNVGEILTMLFAMSLALPMPLLPIQILWINLITDGLPAMALGVDQPERELMKRKPRGAHEHIFSNGLGWKIVSRGFLIGLCTVAAFVASGAMGHSLLHSQTIAFATLVLAQLIHVFDCRSSRSIFHRPILENRTLVGAVALSLALLLAVLYVPRAQPIFHTESLGLIDWLLTTAFAMLPTFLLGVTQLWHRKE